MGVLTVEFVQQAKAITERLARNRHCGFLLVGYHLLRTA
jgi:hypothetical protein